MQWQPQQMATLQRPRRRNRPLAAWRKAKAVELAVEGHTYDAIAKQVGFSNRGTAYRVVRKALDEQIAENVDELRATEVARLDALQAAVWPAVMAGPRGRPAGHRVDREARAAAGAASHRPARARQAAAPGHVIAPEGWTYNEQRRQWDVTPEALERHKMSLR